ncbi:MAG: glycosyltransferase family 2 protein, partial [Candidatus Caldarchaeum sp.]
MRNQSLVSQDFDVEVIVVDDGSRDGTARVVEEFVHSHPDKVRLVRLERNMGLGNARNVGVSLARGSVVVFLDADMEFQPDFVRRLTEPILSGKTLATCHSTEIVGNACNPWVKAQGQKIRGFPQAARTGSIRAVDKRFFLQSGGFDASKGYFDDTSFHEKTGLESVVVDVSLIHRNPDTVREIFWRNRWIGRSVLKAHKLVEVL